MWGLMSSELSVAHTPRQEEVPIPQSATPCPLNDRAFCQGTGSGRGQHLTLPGMCPTGRLLDFLDKRPPHPVSLQPFAISNDRWQSPSHVVGTGNAQARGCDCGECAWERVRGNVISWDHLPSRPALLQAARGCLSYALCAASSCHGVAVCTSWAELRAALVVGDGLSLCVHTHAQPDRGSGEWGQKKGKLPGCSPARQHGNPCEAAWEPLRGGTGTPASPAPKARVEECTSFSGVWTRTQDAMGSPHPRPQGIATFWLPPTP